MSYNRQLSPGSRRLANPARASDSLTDPYRYERNSSYQSPRTSAGGGVIPISTQTFVNYPPAASNSTSRPDQRVDPYTGRPRRSSLVDAQRGSVSSTALPSRSRPTVVQTDFARPASPQKSSTRDKEYYITPASSKEPRKVEHKKLYSVDNGQASLVADVDLPTGSGRHHRRRESDGGERAPYKNLASDRDNDRGRRGYHMNGPAKSKDKSIEDDDAYSYTDAAGMFRDTEPRWREPQTRPRRGSVDRGGASRERPVSMLDPNLDPRRSTKEIGPPPSMRGWAKVNDGLGRATSLREKARDVPQSPHRARVPQSPTRARAPASPSRGRFTAEAVPFGDPKDQQYYVAPRTTSEDRRQPERQAYDQYDHEDRSRRHERRSSVTRPDPSVERRGFGIRTDGTRADRADSQDRYGRRSDESVEPQKYRDSGYEPHRRDTAPELNYHEVQKLEQEKQERMRAERLRNEERDRPTDRDGRDEHRRRDDDRSYNKEQDRDREPRSQRDREHDLDRERERERERMMERPSEPERHHFRRTSNQHYLGRDGAVPFKDESSSQPGVSAAAAGGIGLAAGAAAIGVGKVLNRNDDRDRDRERERDRDPDRRPERPREQDRERLSPRPARSHETHSDEGVRYSEEREAPRAPERERGLGFAFEGAPEPQRSAAPVRDAVPPRERAEEREVERQHEDKAPGQIPHQPDMDPDEDYRRRMEQVQREMGRSSDSRAPEADPDRERRRREREQRQRERDRNLNGDPSVVGTAASYDTAPSSRMPGGYEDSVEGAPSSSFRPGLTRKRSILDEPMTHEPSQIIDNSMSDRKENRVRIVDPPTEEEERRPKGILKKPTPVFPDHGGMREGVAPLKDATKSGIPPGARWTKIDRKLVNPEALEEAQERFEERLDCVIVLRVLTKEEIQKLADRTKELRGTYHRSHSATTSHDSEDSDSTSDDEGYRRADTQHAATPIRPHIDRSRTAPSTPTDGGAPENNRTPPRRPERGRAWTIDPSSRFLDLLRHTLTELTRSTDERYEEERQERKAARRHDRAHDRQNRDEFDDDSENEFKPRAPRMLEAPSSAAGTTTTGVSAGDPADFVRERRRDGEGEREREKRYMSGGAGTRSEY
ncbi:hypothetical protein LTR09_007228 [Extremus antarcticus]|uniref:DUF8035 domain-containing protein n=1 Tax=Extremus antarcticus TaxID=702011 RepID=A0AAJ0DD26_9PEZI|nr:hypothetical protein LTR09_007228 [Extremus antarcticus]